MRVLLVVHHYPPDVNPTGKLMGQLATELARRGHPVRVLTTFPHYAAFRVWPEYRRRVRARSRQDGVEVDRVWCFAPGRKSMPNRLLNYLSYNLGALVAGWGYARSYDVLLCPNGSFFTGVTGALLAGRHGLVVYDVRDLYPEVPILAGQLRSPAAIRVLRSVEGFMYRRAAHLTVITPAFARYLATRGVPAEKVTVVPNFVDTEVIHPLPRDNPWSARMGLTGTFVAAHAGNLGYAYDFDSLLDAAHALRGERGLCVLLVGDGVLRASVEEGARRRRLDNVRFLPFQAEQDLPWLRASTDVALSLYRPGSARYSMPSKVYEIMASGRPVLASAEPNSDLRRLVAESGAGVCVDPGRADQLAAALVRLRDDPAEAAAMGQRGRAHVQQHYSVGTVVDRYETVLEEVLEEAARAAGQGGHHG